MIELKNLSRQFGEMWAVRDLNLTINKGEFCVLVGTSGCGKSTTLRMINRLIEHSAGEIHIDGQPVRGFREDLLRRRIGYVIQHVGLFPHWTVARNIGLVPRLLGWEPERIAARVDELMALLGMSAERFSGKYPRQLSGGQAQRVGVARALAADPEILLMDEPFGALDPLTRDGLQEELLSLHHRLNKTIVFVTHDMDEALRLADRLVVMHEGQIRQQGRPIELLREPVDEFVESLLGGNSRGLKEAALTPVAQRLCHAEMTSGVPDIDANKTLRDALSLMLWHRVDCLNVVEGSESLGTLRLADVVTARAPMGTTRGLSS
ncbi:ABC transporter ATP-binding protein [Halomonas halocynthiae]|uniref:ABC transporter ATP-binding protein n=1 Tax=Halomonas halocynthiae TaxID=176290 RepID=UPI000412D687|nr:ABC transporter ATP-binding protein [Halomonas halocynthiae]